MKYSLVMRGNPRYPERGQKVFASAQCTKTLSQKEFIESIMQHGSSYSRSDYMAIISRVAEELTEKLKEGYRVDLNELGRFYPTLECEGADSFEAFNPDVHIKEIRVNWQPGEEFKQLRQGATFQLNMNRRVEYKLLMAKKRGESTVQLGHNKRQAEGTEEDA